MQFALDMVTNPALSGVGGETLLCISEPGALNQNKLLNDLQIAGPGHNWWVKTPTSGRFILAGTIAENSIQSRNESGGAWPCLVTRTINGNHETVLVWFVHLASPMGSGSRDIHTMQTGHDLRSAVEATEILESNSQSVLIGDFNMRPYDAGMLAPKALNAAACQHAARLPRKVAGTKYRHFYNPCWELLGNWETSRQPGTFYNRDRTDAVRWWLIDQVLIRPSIAHWLQERTPRIITKVGPHELVTPRGVINSDISDHLPVVVSLSI